MKRPTARRSLILIAGSTILVLVILIALDAYYLNWSSTGFGPKTLWDWLDLLIIPIVLTAGGLWFSRQEKRYEQEIADKRRQDDLEIADKRRQDEQQIAESRSQNEALQAYLDKMTELLLKEDLRTSTEASEVRSVARARTLTVLDRLDKGRRIAVLRFLIEARLIEPNEPIISLAGGELSDYDLSGANLSGATLEEANLRETNLQGASLRGTNLQGAYLNEARLSRAALTRATLSRADLRGTNLQGAYLSEANLQGAYLIGANLQGASLFEANLEGADLLGATLLGANLFGATLLGATLQGAILPTTPHTLPTDDHADLPTPRQE